MEDDEAIEQGVVVLDCSCDLRPAIRGDGGGIEEDGELVERIANVPRVGAWRGAKAGMVFFCCGTSHHWKGIWENISLVVL